MEELYYDNDADLIDRHLMGRTTDSEKEEIKRRMETDENFRQHYNEAARIKQLVVAHERKTLWAKLANEEQQFKASGASGGTVLPRWSLYAAAALLVIGLGITWFYMQPDDSPLYAQYYQPYTELEFARTRGGGELEAALQQAVEWYHDKHYQEVINSLETLEQKDDRVNFVLGLAYLGTEQFETALARFNEVSEEFDQPDVFHWYKGLVLIKLNRMEEAKEELERVDRRRFPVNSIVESIQ